MAVQLSAGAVDMANATFALRNAFVTRDMELCLIYSLLAITPRRIAASVSLRIVMFDRLLLSNHD